MINKLIFIITRSSSVCACWRMHSMQRCTVTFHSALVFNYCSDFWVCLENNTQSDPFHHMCFSFTDMFINQYKYWKRHWRFASWLLFSDWRLLSGNISAGQEPSDVFSQSDPSATGAPCLCHYSRRCPCSCDESASVLFVSQCKHILAAYLCQAMGVSQQESVSDQQMAAVLSGTAALWHPSTRQVMSTVGVLAHLAPQGDGGGQGGPSLDDSRCFKRDTLGHCREDGSTGKLSKVPALMSLWKTPDVALFVFSFRRLLNVFPG